MSNKEKKDDNDTLRKLNETLNALTRISIEKDKIVEEIPEITTLEKYKENNTPDVVEDEAFSNLVEQVAALQFIGKNKDEICKILSIDTKTFKDVVLDENFQNVKKRLAEDKKVYILSQLLDRIDEGMTALRELISTSDEDKTRLNAVALLLEQTTRLLDDQKTASVDGYADLLKRSNVNPADVERVNFAQVILRARSERGLK
jgi:hypothetical protein